MKTLLSFASSRVKSIGKHIRELRQHSGLSLHEVAASLDVTPEDLNNIEKGRIHATKTQIFQLASYLGTDGYKMLTTYLREQLSQPKITGETSKRVKEINGNKKTL